MTLRPADGDASSAGDDEGGGGGATASLEVFPGSVSFSFSLASPDPTLVSLLSSCSASTTGVSGFLSVLSQEQLFPAEEILSVMAFRRDWKADVPATYDPMRARIGARNAMYDDARLIALLAICSRFSRRTNVDSRCSTSLNELEDMLFVRQE